MRKEGRARERAYRWIRPRWSNQSKGVFKRGGGEGRTDVFSPDGQHSLVTRGHNAAGGERLREEGRARK